MTANQLKISVDTIKCVLRENCLFGPLSTNKPNLSVRQIKFYLMWCKSRQKWNETDWSKVIECPLYLNNN